MNRRGDHAADDRRRNGFHYVGADTGLPYEGLFWSNLNSNIGGLPAQSVQECIFFNRLELAQLDQLQAIFSVFAVISAVKYRVSIAALEKAVE
jgi:hypothetical protein